MNYTKHNYQMREHNITVEVQIPTLKVPTNVHTQITNNAWNNVSFNHDPNAATHQIDCRLDNFDGVARYLMLQINGENHSVTGDWDYDGFSYCKELLERAYLMVGEENVLERVLKNVRSLTVKHAEIPSSFYNMEERDCTFKIGVTHVSFMGSHVASNFHKYQVKIRPGYYNSDTLVAEVNTQMSLIPLDFWNGMTGILAGQGHMTHLGGSQTVIDAQDTPLPNTTLCFFGKDIRTHQFYFQINQQPAGSTVTAQHNWRIHVDHADMPYQFGWISSNATAEGHEWDHVAPPSWTDAEKELVTIRAGGVPRLAANSHIYLTLKELAHGGGGERGRTIFGHNSQVTKNGYGVLARYPLKAPVNFMNYVDSNKHNNLGMVQGYRVNEYDVKDISELNVQWVDGQGDPVNFHGYDHSFTLEVYHEP